MLSIFYTLHVNQFDYLEIFLMSLKTRAKNFTPKEVSALVDLVQENKSKLFGSFCSPLTLEEKNRIWQNIADSLNETFGAIWTKEDASKKCSNTLSKYKPQISDKISSTKKTGGRPAEAGLSELEFKIHSIKGKDIFGGITVGIDTSMEPPMSPLRDIDMRSSPTASSEIMMKRPDKGAFLKMVIVIHLKSDVGYRISEDYYLKDGQNYRYIRNYRF